VRNAAILLACLLGAVVVAGCGGGGGGGGVPLSKEDYEQQMQRLSREVESTLDRMSAAFDDASDVSAELIATADLLDDESRSLDGIEPPEEVADEHQTLIDKSAAAADELRKLADGASVADLLGVFGMEEFEDPEATVREIKAKGYDIGDGW
jgi:hypothetical protein